VLVPLALDLVRLRARARVRVRVRVRVSPNPNPNPNQLDLLDLVVAALPRDPQRRAAAVAVDLGALERAKLRRPTEVAPG